MYVKLIDGVLVEAPEELVLDDGYIIKNFNRSINSMIQNGYRPLVDTKPGYDVDTQYCVFKGYINTECYIRCEWEVIDIEFPEAEVINQEAQKAMEMLNMDFQEQIQTLSDSQALLVSSIYPKWKVDIEYTVGYKVKHDGILYKVLQYHRSQETWTPDITPSLYARVIVGENNPDTGEQEILDWIQPDSTNAYMTGDKVRYDGVVYESTMDNNIWSPVDYPAAWKAIEG